MAQLIKEYTMFVQFANESNEVYKKRFDGCWMQLLNKEGAYLTTQSLLPQLWRKLLQLMGNGKAGAPNAQGQAEGGQILEIKLKACFMLSSAHNQNHKGIKCFLENACTLEDNKFPIKTAALLIMLNNCTHFQGRFHHLTHYSLQEGG